MTARLALVVSAAVALACGDTLIDHGGSTFLNTQGDGGSGGAGLSCQAPNHVCGAACVTEDAASCGDACTACPPPTAHGLGVCSSHACGFQCSAGYLRCAAGCCTATAVAGGAAHTCAAASDGSVACWGANDAGQLGLVATIPQSLSPATVAGLAGATAVAAGGSHACAIASGAAWCWGSNARGQLGDGSTTSSATPVAVIGLAGVPLMGIVAGDSHTCARATSGAVYCWGDNGSGQLGTAGSGQRSTPAAVPGLAATALAAGLRHNCALSSGGTVSCWGANAFGQLGSGPVGASSPSPVTPVSSNAISVAAGGAHSCAGLKAGSGLCWGAGASGQLGNNATPATQPGPVALQGSSASVIMSSLAAGDAFTCASGAGAAAKCWGANASGQLGIGTTGSPVTSPVDTGLVFGVLAVAAGGAHACALVQDPAPPNDVTVRCWGANGRGQLGDGTSTQRPVPTPISG